MRSTSVASGTFEAPTRRSTSRDGPRRAEMSRDEPRRAEMSRAEVSHGEPVRRGEPRRAEAGRDAEVSRGLALNSMTWSMWPTPSEVSIPSSFSACTTVRGKPSRMKPLPQSGVEMLSLMMPITCDWGGGRWAAGAKSRDACGGREQRGLAGARCTRLAQYTSDTRP